ncbi:MAG: hypothetical protein ACI89D_000939 [Bermanella sp.]|jgi:hypothetical protein
MLTTDFLRLINATGFHDDTPQYNKHDFTPDKAWLDAGPRAHRNANISSFFVSICIMNIGLLVT